MSASDKVSMQTEEVLRVELEFFRQEHRDLDQAIVALSNTCLLYTSPSPRDA